MVELKATEKMTRTVTLIALKECRTALNLSQAAFGELLGWSQQNQRNLEKAHVLLRLTG